METESSNLVFKNLMEVTFEHAFRQYSQDPKLVNNFHVNTKHNQKKWKTK